MSIVFSFGFCWFLERAVLLRNVAGMGEDGSKMARRWLQDGPGGPLGRLWGAPWEALGGPLGPLGGLRGPLRGLLRAFAGVVITKAKVSYLKSPVRNDVEPSWGRLGAILGPSWGRLGANLGPSWAILGPLGAVFGRLGRRLASF